MPLSILLLLEGLCLLESGTASSLKTCEQLGWSALMQPLLCVTLKYKLTEFLGSGVACREKKQEGE
jgi:hypothetical protein